MLCKLIERKCIWDYHRIFIIFLLQYAAWFPCLQMFSLVIKSSELLIPINPSILLHVKLSLQFTTKSNYINLSLLSLFLTVWGLMYYIAWSSGKIFLTVGMLGVEWSTSQCKHLYLLSEWGFGMRQGSRTWFVISKWSCQCFSMAYVFHVNKIIIYLLTFIFTIHSRISNTEEKPLTSLIKSCKSINRSNTRITMGLRHS